MITTKLLAWVCGGLLAALLITGGFAGCEHHDASAARAERDAANAARDTAVDANKSNGVTIAAQDAALNKWMKLGASPEEVAKAMGDAARAIKASNKYLADMTAAMEKDRANPDCGALLGASVQRACPAIARGLRDGASGHQDGARRDPGSGGEATPDAAHGGLRAEVSIPR